MKAYDPGIVKLLTDQKVAASKLFTQMRHAVEVELNANPPEGGITERDIRRTALGRVYELVRDSEGDDWELLREKYDELFDDFSASA
jgi:hypothetical protein